VGIGIQRRLAGLLSRSRVVRVVLHPPCIDHPRRFERILSMIRMQLADHQPVTYFELLSLLRSLATDRRGRDHAR
jgi:hypothetical protein